MGYLDSLKEENAKKLIKRVNYKNDTPFLVGRHMVQKYLFVCGNTFPENSNVRELQMWNRGIISPIDIAKHGELKYLKKLQRRSEKHSDAVINYGTDYDCLSSIFGFDRKQVWMH